MKSKVIKIILLIGLLGGVAWFFDIDHLDLEENRNSQTSNQGAPILRNEPISQVFDRDFEGTVDEIIALANQARESEGLEPLLRNEKLVQSAMAKAQDMKAKNYFEHVSPEGIQPWFFAEEVGYAYKTFGENLAEGFFSSQEVHDAWMKSEGHRENIVSPNFEEIGVAILDFEQNGLKSYLIVQHFGVQLTKLDLEPKMICDKEGRENCEEIEDKKEEIEDAIDEQKDIIKDAKRKKATKDSLKKLDENLENLRDYRDEIDKYQKVCEKFIDGCDQWE